VVNGDQTLCSRPLSAKVVMERASKLRITSGKTLDPRSTEIKDSVTEVQALESISRNKVDVKKIKTNSYQIKNKNTVYGISGYRAQKLVDPEQAAEELRAQEKSRNSKFSPFLMYPMDAKPPETALYDSSSNSSNGLFSLEYFIFPENLDRDPVEATYNRLRETMPDSRIYGFTRYFDNKGGFTWRRCEVLRYNPTDEKLTVKWIDKFVTKDVTRANFYFEAENEKEYFKMLENAKKWREYSCTFMRYLDIVDKMDTPSNSLQDKIKDRIIFLVMDNCFRVKPPREPTAREKISLQERFKSSLFLNNRPELNLPPGYSIVDHFRDKKYDLKYLNRLTEEIEREFVRANHQIEFNNSLPYNEERQKMFRGFLDEELFIPRFILNQRQLGHDGLVVKLSPDKRELHDFLALYSTVKDNVHQANLERSRLIHSANLSLFEIRGYLFALTEFEKAYDIKDFLGREEDKSREFFRSTGNHVGDINHELLKIVNRENEELKKRNEDRERKIQTLAERLAKMENELPAQVVRVISRFQTMLNFKFEYTIKEALRNSLFAYNRSFANVLGRFERILNKREGDVDYENLSYNMLLDYQNHMQYQEHQTDCPLISLRLSVGAKIQVDEAFQTLQQALKDVNSLSYSSSTKTSRWAT
jgi:hypothetical protein